MASIEIQDQPSFRRSSPTPENDLEVPGTSGQILRSTSPSPSVSPTPAIGSCPELSRRVSTGSSSSTLSERSSSIPRESLGISTNRSSSATFIFRSSSTGYSSRQSSGGVERPKRRGYVRPQGTNFAASAQSRESVMSLGSIAHLQYYFARTGLLDGKGGRLMKKKDSNETLDLSSIDTNLLSPTLSDKDSTYSSMRSSPELTAVGMGGDVIVESPIEEGNDYYSGGEDEDHQEMLPPTVSTYNYRPKAIPPPPTLEELKSDLTRALNDASKVLQDAKDSHLTTPPSPRRRSESDAIRTPESPATPSANQGWYELQGMTILDVITLAIRAAKRYYTAHDQPTRLSTIKSERQIRKELLSVMDVLKRMATRNFAHGMRNEERETMETWIESVWEMLRREEEMELREKEQRRSWTWMDDSLWLPSFPSSKPSVRREYEFLKSMDSDPDTLPEYIPLSSSDISASGSEAFKPSPFLESLQNGVRLVKLHNTLVRKSKRPFGAIATFHTDTAKPYRCAENLRFWIKAAELRWEVLLKVDVMGVVNGTDQQAWEDFENAIWRWSRKVREELTAELSVEAK
jgi:hypothetical protein